MPRKDHAIERPRVQVDRVESTETVDLRGWAREYVRGVLRRDGIELRSDEPMKEAS